jgi:hypothetical protein
VLSLTENILDIIDGFTPNVNVSPSFFRMN